MAARDVADYILAKLGPMSAMKLQKLVYYSLAWHMVWAEEELFLEPVEAWANGPVVRSLYDQHRGRFRLNPGHFRGNPSALTDHQRDSIDRVIEFYGDKDPQWLSDLTHMEAPWRETRARADLGDGESGTAEIGRDVIMEYYSSL